MSRRQTHTPKSIMVLAPDRKVKGIWQGHDPRIHSGNLTRARQQPPQLPLLPHGILSPLCFFPTENIPAKVVMLLWHSCQSPASPDLFGSTWPRNLTVFWIKSRIQVLRHMWDLVLLCLCVSISGKQARTLKKILLSVAQNRVVTVKGRLKGRVNKVVVSHVPLFILSTLHRLPNLHPTLLTKP